MKLKTLLISLAACLSANAFAGSSYDGVFYCNMNVAGTLNTTYITINSTGNTVVYAIPNVSAGQYWSGYGVGTQNGTIVTGTTSTNQPFTVTYGDMNTITFSTRVVANGSAMAANGNCSRVI